MSHDKICAKLEFLCSCAWLRRAYATAQGAVIFEDSTMSLLDQLNEMRRFGGAIRTHGLADAQVTQLAAQYPELVEAIRYWRPLLDPDALLIDLGFDEPCQVSQGLLPTQITSLGWNDVRYARLHDVQLNANRHFLQRHSHLYLTR